MFVKANSKRNKYNFFFEFFFFLSFFFELQQHNLEILGNDFVSQIVNLCSGKVSCKLKELQILR